jgi:MFS family permease
LDAQASSVSIFAPRWRALTIGSLMLIAQVAFEAMAVTTAMPTVARALDGLSLYAIAFGITFATSMVGMVLSGQWSDARGPSAPLLNGAAWFAAGLLVAGFATSMLGVIIGRAMQGFGSGMVVVALYVVTARAYPAELRPSMFAAFAGAWVIPSLVGPLLAGLVAQYIGWRWVFLGVAILVLPGALLTRAALRRCDLHNHEDIALYESQDRRARNRRRLLLAIGAAASTAFLHYAGQQRGLTALLLLVVSFACVFLFGTLLLPRGSILLRPGLPSVIALRGIAAGAYITAEVFVPLMLSMQRGLSAAMAGLSLTAGGVLWAIGSWYQARPTQPFSRKGLLTLGMLVTAAGIVVSALVLIPSVPAFTAMLSWGLAGLGLGLVYPTLSVLTLELSRREEQGENSSGLQLSDAMFSTASLAVAGSLFAALVASSSQFAYLATFLVALALAVTGAAVSRRVA